MKHTQDMFCHGGTDHLQFSIIFQHDGVARQLRQPWIFTWQEILRSPVEVGS